MNGTKQRRRKTGAQKLEPIDWHEFANDAVLNGNMSTLYHRPATEDPSAYASPEALVEIEKRVGRPAQAAVVIDVELPAPTVGPKPTVGTEALSIEQTSTVVHQEPIRPTVGHIPTVRLLPTVGTAAPPVVHPARIRQRPTVGEQPT